MKSNQVTTTYLLSDVDFKNRKGVLRVMSPGQFTRKLIVDLTPRLVHKLVEARKDDDAFQYEDVPFTSTLDDPEYFNNPFSLVQFVNKETGGHINFRLKMVDEGLPIKREIMDVFNRRYNKIVRYSYNAPKDYLRFRVAEVG